MNIKNKEQNIRLLDELNLNRIESHKFSIIGKNIVGTKGYKDMLTSLFFGDLKCSIRSNIPGGIFIHDLTFDEFIVATYSLKGGDYYLVESLKQPDDKNMIVQGYVKVTKDYDVVAELNRVKGLNMREAMRNPPIILTFNDLYDRSPRYLNKILDLIYKHELFDHIVEFTQYDCAVGVKKENIIIWEVRNY